MKKIKFYVFILVAVFALSGCGRAAEVKPAAKPVSTDGLKPGLVVRDQKVSNEAVKETGKGETPETAVGLANPASVLCEKLGFTLKMETTEAGTSGFCQFADGSRCDEWQFFRGECGAEKRNVSLEAVNKHSTEKDCWQAIAGKVYDLSAYIPSHPGGKALLSGCGQDATELYNKKPGSSQGHSAAADALLQDYYLADLAK